MYKTKLNIYNKFLLLIFNFFILMINKNTIKLIKSLSFKKYRDKYNLFLVEGEKCIDELLSSSYEFKSLYCTKKLIKKYVNYNVTEITENDLNKISTLSKPNNILATVYIKQKKIKHFDGITLVLDGINNPGNLGTIIRTCDWFGVKNIVCSQNSVDVFNSKVVQSTMGSIFRVNIFYTNLIKYLNNVTTPIYAASLDGLNLSDQEFSSNLHLVMGNESNGIRNEILKLVDKKICIDKKNGKAESLNVSICASIFLYKIFS